VGHLEEHDLADEGAAALDYFKLQKSKGKVNEQGETDMSVLHWIDVVDWMMKTGSQDSLVKMLTQPQEAQRLFVKLIRDFVHFKVEQWSDRNDKSLQVEYRYVSHLVQKNQAWKPLYQEDKQHFEK
jgi:hypothetical protein